MRDPQERGSRGPVEIVIGPEAWARMSEDKRADLKKQLEAIFQERIDIRIGEAPPGSIRFGSDGSIERISDGSPRAAAEPEDHRVFPETGQQERPTLEELIDQLEEQIGPRRGPIPHRFERTFEGRPFHHCDFCRRPLRRPGTVYMIIKYHAENELSQELAICQACMADLRKGYSEQSLRATEAHYAGERMQERRNLVREIAEPDADALTHRCWRCTEERTQVSQSFDYALCDGEQMLYAAYPFMQCGDCTLELARALSDETLEFRQRFFENHFGLPPDAHAFEPAEYEPVEILLPL